jgi:hypothetical protein
MDKKHFLAHASRIKQQTKMLHVQPAMVTLNLAQHNNQPTIK